MVSGKVENATQRGLPCTFLNAGLMYYSVGVLCQNVEKITTTASMTRTKTTTLTTRTTTQSTATTTVTTTWQPSGPDGCACLGRATPEEILDGYACIGTPAYGTLYSNLSAAILALTRYRCSNAGGIIYHNGPSAIIGFQYSIRSASVSTWNPYYTSWLFDKAYNCSCSRPW